MVRYCAAIMIFSEPSDLTSPENPGTSGIQTMTCIMVRVVSMSMLGTTKTDLKLRTLLSSTYNPLHKSLGNLVFDLFSVFGSGDTTNEKDQVSTSQYIITEIIDPQELIL
jgi:hypothetical protein